MRHLPDYLPPVLQQVEEFKEILAAEQSEFEELEEKRLRILKNQFIETADIEGLSFLERGAGMVPAPGAGQEERRFALTMGLMEKRPVTGPFLEAQLKSLCGVGGYTLAIIPAQYKIQVRLALAKKRSMDGAINLLTRLKPANMVLDIDLLYNRHRQLTVFTQSAMGGMKHRAIRADTLPGVK